MITAADQTKQEDTVVRSILEYAAVVWHAVLTQINTSDIERVQKAALSIILGKNYISYNHALEVLKLKPLL